MNYWHEEVEINALLLLSAARRQGDSLDGDAAISMSGAAHIATSYASSSQDKIATQTGTQGGPGGVPANKRARGDGGGAPPKKAPKTTKAQPEVHTHNVVNGLFTASRKENLCATNFKTVPATLNSVIMCVSAPSAWQPMTVQMPAVKPRRKERRQGKGVGTGSKGRNQG